jgi:hypothetical protein
MVFYSFFVGNTRFLLEILVSRLENYVFFDKKSLAYAYTRLFFMGKVKSEKIPIFTKNTEGSPL